jgi:hypothetical protein
MNSLYKPASQYGDQSSAFMALLEQYFKENQLDDDFIKPVLPQVKSPPLTKQLASLLSAASTLLC